MSVIHAIIAAFSCFSRIPMPSLDWERADLRYMMAAFPLIGVVIGACYLLWGELCTQTGLSTLSFGAGVVLIPLLVTGGIHMDGFADVIDALSSHASPERKREILKDPHAGAFAIMGVCGYLIATLALAAEVGPSHAALLAVIPIVSRCVSGLATVSLRSASTNGMYATEQGGAQTHAVQALLALVLCTATIALALLDPIAGIGMAVVAGLTLWVVWRLAQREFGGMSGDLAGYYLQVAELAMLGCMVIAERLG